MNKTVKIISVLLITVLLIGTMSQVCFATSGKVDYSSIINTVHTKGNTETVDTSDINTTAAKVIKAIRNIAAIAAVVILTILGVKYMIGSTEERAEYKKSFIPLIVGIIVVVSAASIASALFSIAA